MDADRLLRIYQGYSLAKISALNKQQLIAQYAQCQTINDLEKSLKRELSAVSSTNRKILENQLKEEKRREETKYYRNTAYKAKEAIELIHSTSDDNFKCFLLKLFAQPFGNILKDVKNQLEEFSDKEFCDRWLSQLNNDKTATTTNGAYINSPWHQLLESESDYQDKIDSLKVWEKEIADKKSAIKQPAFIQPEPKDKKIKSGYIGITIVLLIFALLVTIINLSEGASWQDLSFFEGLAVFALIAWIGFALEKKQAKQQWIANYDSYVAEIQRKNTVIQSEYDNMMDEISIDENNLNKARAEMNNHPYSVALTNANNAITNWQDKVNTISSLLPAIEDKAKQEYVDPLLKDFVQNIAKGSFIQPSSIQRRYSIGCHRATAILAKLEELGIVSSEVNGKPRNVLVDPNTAKSIVEKL